METNIMGQYEMLRGSVLRFHLDPLHPRHSASAAADVSNYNTPAIIKSDSLIILPPCRRGRGGYPSSHNNNLLPSK